MSAQQGRLPGAKGGGTIARRWVETQSESPKAQVKEMPHTREQERRVGEVDWNNSKQTRIDFSLEHKGPRNIYMYVRATLPRVVCVYTV